MPEASHIQDSWARSIKIKELQEELGKVRAESWALLSAERVEEAFALKKQLERLDGEIAELKAEEAKAKERIRRAKEAAAASAGVLAIPDKGRQLQALHEELEQARATEDLDRAVEVRKSILALQDDRGDASSSSTARGPLALPGPATPLAIADATNPDFDPRTSPDKEFEVPIPKRRGAAVTSEPSLTGRAAERYTAMKKELQEAIESKDDAAAADLRRRLEVFKAQFMESEISTRDADPQAEPRRQGAKGRGKGRGGAREPRPGRGAGRAAGSAGAKAKAAAGAPATARAPASTGLTASQTRAKEQARAWRQEVELLEQGLLDYRGDEDCRQAVDMRQRRDEMRAKIEELERAAAEAGTPGLDALLSAIDEAKNPDSRQAQLAALARLNRDLAKR